MKLISQTLLICISILAFSSCATYNLSTQSLLEQAAKSSHEKKTLIFVAFPLFYAGTVTGNNLRSIECLDKDGNTKIIRVTQRTGIRVTKKDNTRKTFYFDTLIIKDSIITGSVTHFGNVQIKPIKLADIAKIEIMK